MKYLRVVILLLVLLVAACSSESAPTPAAAPTIAAATQPAKVAENVEIKTFSFKPNRIKVKAGSTVTWTNQDGIEHSITGGLPPTPSGAFDSDFITKGQTFSFAFDKPGEYTYFCKRHNSMQGMVSVTP
ncbi:MAG: cupredoxin domain-containing protein [Chloroflexi bacterium]|nr:cupredoxin domain-containing protein [Chloroflexota bacterium]